MRLILVALVVILATNVGVNAIKSIKGLSDARQQQVCQIDPSYCKK